MSLSRSRSSHGGLPFSANRTSASSNRTAAAVSTGQKYPEIKQRGYYSDILGDEAEKNLGNILTGPQTAQDTLWNVAKETHMPRANTFIGPDAEHLLNEIKSDEHGPSTEITAISDFPVKSYEPKVQLPFFTPPGHCPRKIEIERRKRQYAKLNLLSLLEQEGIDTEQLMPKAQVNGNNNVKLNVDPDDPAPFPPFLPLEIFDSFEFDCRTPEDWLHMGRENGIRKPVPGKALLPSDDQARHMDPTDPSITYEWHDVGMLDYDPESQLYLVQKTNAEGRIVDGRGYAIINGGLTKHGNRIRTNSQYWIPRVRLTFCAEDPETFASRVANAFCLRKNTESLLRYHLYIDCMPMDGVGQLDQASLKRMIDWAKGTPSLSKQKGLEDYIQVLEKEINIAFCRSMNKIIFDDTVAEDPKTFAFVTLPEIPLDVVPERGCIEGVPDYPFDEQYDNFAFNALLTREESISAIGKVRTECNKVAAMSLFHVPMTKSMRIEEFEQTQSQATSQVALFLKDSWITTLRAAIRTSLRDVGKGWFNIHETNWEVYQISKLKKFMEMVKFNMQDSLRYLVQDSLVGFTQMILDACHNTMESTEELVWETNLLVSNFKPKKNPLFLVDLMLDVQGAHYSTNLNSFETVLVSLFDRGIQSTQNVPQLEKSIMEEIFWSGTPLLESVGEHEPHVEDMRDYIRHATNKAIIPMKAYAKQYEQFLELFNMDINQYINEWMPNIIRFVHGTTGGIENEE